MKVDTCKPSITVKWGNIMSGRHVEETVKRRLYSESMGRCMNPACQQELFCKNGDMIEKAHIDPYCETADNSLENLVLLCPNCHTNFDKNKAFEPEEVLGWKRIRKEELEKFFGKRYETFSDLKAIAAPLLERNHEIYQHYYLGNKKELWDKFEFELLSNNRKLKELFSANLNLFQKNTNKSYSNVDYVRSFLSHVDEFEISRAHSEKIRQVLFPAEINSMFGVSSVTDSLIPSTESLEALIRILSVQNKFEEIVLHVERPYLQMIENNNSTTVFLDDTPRLRQLYDEYNCFRSPKVRLDSLHFALKYIHSNHLDFQFSTKENLREIIIRGTKLIFVYEYCLSYAFLTELAPEEKNVIVNLHNWNGEGCISKDAYGLAETMDVKLLTMDAFYQFIRKIKRKC